MAINEEGVALSRIEAHKSIDDSETFIVVGLHRDGSKFCHTGEFLTKQQMDTVMSFMFMCLDITARRQ